MMDRFIETLDARLRPMVYDWLHIVRDDLGLNVRATEGLRDKARQEAVFAAGASKVKVGFHNYGLALDFACIETSGVYITDGDAPEYMRCGLVWEAVAFPHGYWGGRWKMKDSGHIEWHPEGKSLQQVIDSGVIHV